MDTLHTFFAEHPTLWSRIAAIPWQYLHDTASVFLADPAHRGITFIAAWLIYYGIRWTINEQRPERRRNREWQAHANVLSSLGKVANLEQLASLRHTWTWQDRGVSDHARRWLRDQYFSVADIEDRKALIAAHNEAHEALRNDVTICLNNAREALNEAKAFQLGPCNASVFFAPILVWLGWTWFAVPGAIAAAVIAYLEFHRRLGIAAIAQRETVAQAQSSYDQAAEWAQGERASFRPLFKDDEAKAGEREEYYDQRYSEAA
jgi:hypothetical protein